jgi:Asp-tRNA(Asn)/Glu-tRNA(Gln) amidotransferase C subunit
MARPVSHGGEAYTIPVVVKMNPEGIRVLDRLRADVPRSTYLRELLRAEARRVSDGKARVRRAD